MDAHDTIELLNDDDSLELFKETLLAQLCGSRLQEHRFHQSLPRSLVQRSRQRAMTSTRGVEGVARLITENRRRGRRARMRRHIEHARRRRRPHEDPVARHESKPSCRHVVSHTSKHAACKTHTEQFCGPLLSVPLSASGLLTESGARYAAGLYVRLQRAH